MNKSTAVKPVVKPSASKPASKPVLASAKAKAVAFVNWKIVDENGDTLLRSTKGFSLFDNEYLTLEEKALIKLARDNGGRATVQTLMTVVISAEKPESLDTSKITLVK